MRNYLRFWTRVDVVFFVLMILAACSILFSCAQGTAPQNVTEGVYVYGWSLVGASNSVADLHDAKKLKPEQYEKAKSILAEARALYDGAKLYLGKGDLAGAQGQIALAQNLLLSLAAYLTAQGVK